MQRRRVARTQSLTHLTVLTFVFRLIQTNKKLKRTKTRQTRRACVTALHTRVLKYFLKKHSPVLLEQFALQNKVPTANWTTTSSLLSFCSVHPLKTLSQVHAKKNKPAHCAKVLSKMQVSWLWVQRRRASVSQEEIRIAKIRFRRCTVSGPTLDDYCICCELKVSVPVDSDLYYCVWLRLNKCVFFLIFRFATFFRTLLHTRCLFLW